MNADRLRWADRLRSANAQVAGTEVTSTFGLLHLYILRP